MILIKIFLLCYLFPPPAHRMITEPVLISVESQQPASYFDKNIALYSTRIYIVITIIIYIQYTMHSTVSNDVMHGYRY